MCSGSSSTHVEGDDDAGGVVLGQLDGGAEEAVVVVVGGDEARAGVAVEGDADGAAVGRSVHVGLAEERGEALVEGDGRHVEGHRDRAHGRREQQHGEREDDDLHGVSGRPRKEEEKKNSLLDWSRVYFKQDELRVEGPGRLIEWAGIGIKLAESGERLSKAKQLGGKGFFSLGGEYMLCVCAVPVCSAMEWKLGTSQMNDSSRLAGWLEWRPASLRLTIYRKILSLLFFLPTKILYIGGKLSCELVRSVLFLPPSQDAALLLSSSSSSSFYFSPALTQGFNLICIIIYQVLSSHLQGSKALVPLAWPTVQG